MAWYASAIGHRSMQPAGLQIGSRVGRPVHGGHARIGKVNRRSNHYFINQHAHGQQRAGDYSSRDDNNFRCAALLVSSQPSSRAAIGTPKPLQTQPLPNAAPAASSCAHCVHSATQKPGRGWPWC
jgi:hypothetical protein